MRLRINFNTKVLLPMAGIMVALVAATLWVINGRIATQVRDFAADSLRTSRVVLEEFRSQRAKDLVDPRRAFQSDPRFMAIMRTPEPRTLSKLLAETIQERGVDFIVVGDREGLVIAEATRDPAVHLVDVKGRSLIDLTTALDGESTMAVQSRDGQLLDVAVVPIAIDGQVAGTVATGFVLGDATADDLGRLTGCEVALCAGDRLAGLTLTHPADKRALADLLRGPDSPLRAADTAGDSEPQVTDVLINGEHYMALVGFWAAANVPGGRPAYVLLGRYEPQLRRLADTRRLLLNLGLSGVAISMLAAWVIVRGATRPLAVLRESADAVGRGEFSRRVEVQANDELGDLASAFNNMTDNLRVSRERLENTVATLQDTRARLVQSEKLSAMGEFIAGVAHELNNPLTIMVGFAELLRDSDLSAAQKKDIAMIAESAERCHKVVQNLLSFARQRPPERDAVNLSELLETTVRFMAYELKSGGIRVTRAYDSSLPLVMADPNQLQQVFLNIVNNARQAMEGRKEAGLIHLATSAADGRVRVTIADNGPGIPESIVGRIFDPFFTTKADGKGTGLGLSVSYGIVQEHGGDLHVSSEVGRGTTFTIEIPVATYVAASAAAPAATPPPWRAPAGLRAMIVDDEDGILDLVHAVLEGVGVAADRFRDGQTALEASGRLPYDLAICDWRMPGLSGRQLFEQLREQKSPLAQRFIFMTGDVLNLDVQTVVQATGCPGLIKPFGPVELLAAVRKVVENPAQGA